MSHYNPYPAYKDFGVEWLGRVPEGWDAKRFKQVFRERDERSTDGVETLLSVSSYTGVSPRSEIVDEGGHLSRADSLEGYKVCHPNDLVMNIMLAWNRGLAFSNYEGIVSPAYCVFDVVDGSVPGFLNYLVRTDLYTLYFKAFSSGVIDSRLRLYPDVFGSLLCVLPTLREQQTIAAFLDRETARIDALIATQRRLIDLLREKRSALISHAVTKGLDPNVKMKDSGVEWLGMVPEHWQISTLKRDLMFLTSGSRGWAEHYSENGALFIRIGNLTRESIHLDLSDVQRVVVPEGSEGERTKVLPGDVLFSITAYLGSVAVAPDDIKGAYVSQHVGLARILKNLFLPRWVAYVTLSFIGKTYLETQGYGGTKIQLSLNDVANIIMTMPLLDEQAIITSYIDRETSKIDALIGQSEKSILLAQERRSALISAAVTGKIDLRKSA